MTSERSLLALTLLQIDGLGRVGTRRLLESFGSVETICACPLEQIIVRLKGIGNAASIAAQLHDSTVILPLRVRAEAESIELERRGVRLLTINSPEWPTGLSALPSKFAPPILYCYGHNEILQKPAIAFIADEKLSDSAFEHLQQLASTVLARGISIITGTESGVDVVLSKVSVDAAGSLGKSICVASTGLAKVANRIRPIASQVVRAGGALVSTFEMGHGPFDHDRTERIMVQSALATAVVLCGAIPETPDDVGRPVNQVVQFCHAQRKAVFGIGGAVLRPDIHPLHSAVDDEWVLAAIERLSGTAR